MKKMIRASVGSEQGGRMSETAIAETSTATDYAFASSALRFLHRKVSLQHPDDVIELVHFERRKASLQILDALLGFDISAVILLGLQAVALGLPVLADHDEGGGVGGLKRQREIEQNERVGVPMVEPGDHVHHEPDGKHDGLRDDEAPRADGGRHRVRNALAERQFRRVCRVPISALRRHGSCLTCPEPMPGNLSRALPPSRFAVRNLTPAFAVGTSPRHYHPALTETR